MNAPRLLLTTRNYYSSDLSRLSTVVFLSSFLLLPRLKTSVPPLILYQPNTQLFAFLIPPPTPNLHFTQNYKFHPPLLLSTICSVDPLMFLYNNCHACRAFCCFRLTCSLTCLALTLLLAHCPGRALHQEEGGFQFVACVACATIGRLSRQQTERSTLFVEKRAFFVQMRNTRHARPHFRA